MNNNWEYKKIGDICIVERGGSPRPINQFITDDENGINWIKIGDTTESMYITETAQKIKPEGMKKSRYVQPGDFLLSNSMSFGRPYILKIDGCIHDGWLVLRDKDDLFDKRFLYYYLSSKTTYEKFKSMAVGGVVNNLNSEMVRKVDVPIPSKMEQAKTADVLDKLNSVIVMYQQEIQKLDKLIQARFVEMFGDPVQNTKGWSIDTCKNLTSKIGSGATPKGGRESYCTEGIAFVRSMNVYNNRFEYGDLAFINDEQANKLSNVMVQHKDVLLNITGASVARCCIVPDELIPARVNQHVAIVRCKEKILPEFLCSMFTEDNYQKLLWRIATSGGATREAITKQHIENLVLIVPPMKLQEDYVRFSERVNKSKFVIHKFLYCTTHNTQSIIKPRPNTKESGKTRGGKPYADEF